jgi:hypothetical protein
LPARISVADLSVSLRVLSWNESTLAAALRSMRTVPENSASAGASVRLTLSAVGATVLSRRAGFRTAAGVDVGAASDRAASSEQTDRATHGTGASGGQA